MSKVVTYASGRTERFRGDPPRLEVHEHSRIHDGGGRVNHSHADGAPGHHHFGTGPATFTIDKDDWQQQTGLKGGGRKRFTTRPVGPQLTVTKR